MTRWWRTITGTKNEALIDLDSIVGVVRQATYDKKGVRVHLTGGHTLDLGVDIAEVLTLLGWKVVVSDDVSQKK